MVFRAAACLVLAVAAGGVVAPASRQFPAIAPGVHVGPIDVGGLTSEPARAAVLRAYSAPLHVRHGGRTWTVAPARLGAAADVDDAVTRALHAAPQSPVRIEVRGSTPAVRRFVAGIARQVDRPARDAQLVGVADRPQFAAAEQGLAVRRAAVVGAIRHALRSGDRTPIPLPTEPVEPRVTVASFGPVIAIDRGANSLKLFDGPRLVRTFGVATGQSVYPTPAGSFEIVDMQENPWWYPPTTSEWAKGLDPVPPGPGNPLGTRWMGLDAPGVGIHGTPDDASIGYSASHGCIRMHISDAEWLFQHVRVGTPVVIR
jgi:lipoprotein-anchoring transpeptidase ErfK/SrfK